MHTRTRFHLYTAMAAMILTTALAAPAEAQNSCAGLAPGCFKGTFQGEDVHDVLPADATSVAIHTTATGIGTRLGRFSLIREVTGNLIDFSATGSAQWVAANGDRIYTTVFGQAVFSDADGGSLMVTESHVITDGTGRFAGVEGSFVVVLFHKLAPSLVSGGVETHDISGSFHDAVTFPGGR